MIIIKVMGGLGNQMFQYALYKSFLNKGIEAKLDDNGLKKTGNQHNGLELHRVFNLTYNAASEKDIKHLCGNPYSFYRRALRHFFGIGLKNYYIEEEYSFKPFLWKFKRKYLDGYWQSENYFADIRDELLKDFSFEKCDDIDTLDIEKKIQTGISVSVHFRRGDYLKNGNEAIYGGICTENYYKQALDYFNSKYEDASFYVFSDDIEWARNSFINAYNPTYIDNNTGVNSYKDMYLMSKCQHNIIANSSFSWWGAWLNKNPEKEVIMPAKWFNSNVPVDVFCDGWKKI